MKKKLGMLILILVCLIIGISMYKRQTARTFPSKMKNKTEFNDKFNFNGKWYSIYLEDYIYDEKYYRFSIMNEKFDNLLYADFVSQNGVTTYPLSRLLGMIKSYDSRGKFILENSDTLVAVKPVLGSLKDSLH